MQSQLHKVNGRRASGKRIILPKSSISEDGFISMKEELRTQATSTSVNAVGNSIRARSRIFLQSKEVIKLGFLNSLADVIRSMLDKPQNIFMLVMSRAFVACLENCSPIFAKSSSRVIFIIQGNGPLHQ